MDGGPDQEACGVAQAVLCPRKHANRHFGENQLDKALSYGQEEALRKSMWDGFDYSVERAETTIVQPCIQS